MRAKVGVILVLFVMVSFYASWAGSAAAEGTEDTLILRDTGRTYKPYAHLDMLEDPSGGLSLEDVRKPELEERFQANVRKVPNFGFMSKVQWVRFPVANASNSRAWVLELDYPPLDRVDLYIVRTNGEVEHKRSGDRLPFSERDVSNRNVAFGLVLERGESAMIYMRVESSGAMALPIKIMNTVEYAKQEQKMYLLLGGYYGLMLIMVMYNSILAFSFRSKAILTYVGINVSNLLFYSTLNGIAFQYVWPNGDWWNNRAIVFFLCLSHLATLLFANEFLDVKRRHPKLYRLFGGLALLLGINVVVMGVHYSAGLQLSFYSVRAVQLALITAGIMGWKSGYRPARYFLLGWGMFMVGTTVSNLSDGGYIPMHWWTTYASQLGSTIEAVVLSWGLLYQIQTIRKEKELAVAQMKETRRLADLDDLTGLYNRRFIIRAFEEAVQTDEAKPISLIMLDLDHFKKVNDTFGHDAGDQVLQNLASILEECFRPTDIIGRFGGEEFMVLLKNTNAEQARSAAEYVLKSIREQRFKIKDQSLFCTASLGIAQWNEEEGEEFKEMLRRADQALYEAKRGGRNRACMSRPAWRMDVK